MTDPLNLEHVCKKQAQRIAELETRETDWEDAMQFQKKRIAELEARNGVLGAECHKAGEIVTQLRKQNDELAKLVEEQTAALKEMRDSEKEPMFSAKCQECGCMYADHDTLTKRCPAFAGSGAPKGIWLESTFQPAPQSREDAREGLIHSQRAYIDCGIIGGWQAATDTQVTCPECRANMGGAK